MAVARIIREDDEERPADAAAAPGAESRQPNPWPGHRPEATTEEIESDATPSDADTYDETDEAPPDDEPQDEEPPADDDAD